ncbi:MAG: glucose/arabinose dehydrogenase [Natronomonas sp.]|jgi:glucose/arabinose dehydrogenase|uniref:PQQ-dependent sugar dehydrogenase n=1 Tax=Natronomonas sp. TaxID=2184060 RepID=UPI00398A23B6
MPSPRTRRQFLTAIGAAGSLTFAGCITGSDTPIDSSYDLTLDHDIESWDEYDPEWAPPETSLLEASYEVETVIENLEVPWDLTFADDGTLFISERVGRLSRYESGELEAVTTPEDVIDHASSIAPNEEGGWWEGGSEGGLLGATVHPNYPDVPVLYAFYTYQAGEDDYRNRLVYYDLDNGHEEEIIIDDIPGNRIIHNGARLAFGPRNYLWVTTGDANADGVPQDTASLGGKILRLKPDGTAPDSNPGLSDLRVFTYGHRNPQAISWLPDGTPIASEHGPNGRDEVQLLDAGENHGWKAVRGGPQDDEWGSYTDHEATPPLVNTGQDTWGPSGGVFYTGSEVPSLTNRFLSAGLISQRLNVVSVYEESAPDVGGTRFDADWLYPGYEAVAHTLFENELGRIRHVEQGPDGEVYAITSNRDGRASEAFPKEGDDRLVRIAEA